jgi:hypothetical protein
MPVTDERLDAKPGDLWGRLTFSSGRRILGVTASNHSGVEMWLQKVRERYEGSLSASSASSFSAMTAQFVYFLEVQPCVVDLQVGVGSTDTYVTECSVLCSDRRSAQAGEESANDRVRSAARSKRWQIRVATVQPHCLVVRCRIVAGSVLASNAEYAWIPTEQLRAVQASLLRLPGTVAIETGLGVSVQLQEAMYDTDALQELHACHNLRSLPGLLPDEDSVAKFQEMTHMQRLGTVVVQPGQLSAVLKTLNAPHSMSAEPSTEVAEVEPRCGDAVEDRAAKIEQDVSIHLPTMQFPCLALGDEHSLIINAVPGSRHRPEDRRRLRPA